MALRFTIDIVLSEHDTGMCWNHFAITSLDSVRENIDTLKMLKPRDRKDLVFDGITGLQN